MPSIRHILRAHGFRLSARKHRARASGIECILCGIVYSFRDGEPWYSVWNDAASLKLSFPPHLALTVEAEDGDDSWAEVEVSRDGSVSYYGWIGDNEHPTFDETKGIITRALEKLHCTCSVSTRRAS